MAFGLQGVVISLALGGVSALVLYIVKKVQERNNLNQNYQPSSFREQEQVNRQRNIACPFCNKCVQENDRQLSCGHHCHKSCYQKRSARNRNCTYCRNTDEEATTSSTQSSQRYNILNECSYCKSLIQSTEKTFKLGCKHSVHKSCYDSFNMIMKCQACNYKIYQTNP